MALSELTFRNLQSEDEVVAAYPIEAAGYPEDEAASLESMLYRFRNAPHLFLGAFDPSGSIVAYIMSTQADSSFVTHDSMSKHDPKGSTACIHSVCVSPQWQRRGVASKLLALYPDSVRSYNSGFSNTSGPAKITRLAMLARESLVPFYQHAEYKCLGQSSVVHGTERWYDCIYDL
ncbi:hypothetical protein GGI25_004586 [Coemansia spiralis]|uniref:N-acetyltransferase domain-containing protein n=2 Tax=Coemansia TaxID=4863 RepID=A0A9W8KWY1_9FUNG|nr:hypothetical protein BX070DRAFT_224385 [Coemansia spiralis]KAJ1993546.1 hypothetical protein EDC05_002173 [Coemansia umbellata]KAJ2625211.1 hypothetical protein GGI26_000680 [Coemansia sp. RSA 1358]KAJ2673779.1 hypothetical protein GGI25_004586 [Coemansia spiralis]